jgi:serine/threonine protein kinase
LKKLKRNNDNKNNKSSSDFNRELQALLQISARDCPYLMQLLTAFQHGEDFYLVFPLADCSLANCFEKEDPTGNVAYFRWMVGQLAGLASGIHVIHGDASSSSLAVPSRVSETLGYHHDLKPDNILLLKFREGMGFNEAETKYGRLQISDFGLGRFREATTGSKSYNIKGTLTYAAPESYAKGEQARPYDIWSFGCILLEILIWLLKGSHGHQEFNISRYVVSFSIIWTRR